MHQFATSSERSFDRNRCTSKNDDIQSTIEQLPHDASNSIETDNGDLSQQLLFLDARRDGAACAKNAEISQGEDISFANLQYRQADHSNSGQCDDECIYHFSFSDDIGFFHKEEAERDNDEIDDEDDEDSICDSIRVTIRRRLKESNQ